MKKYIALFLALMLFAAGCGKQEEPVTAAAPETTAAPTETAAPETTVPETTLPKTTEVKVMGDHIPVIRLLLARGETVEVTGYESGYALTAGGRVESQFLRFPDEAMENWTGYTQWNAGLYAGSLCLGEPSQKLGTNTKVEVLEKLEDCYFVKVGEETGFIQKSQLSKYPYQAASAEGGSSSSGGGSYSGGAQDGGDITLMGRIRLISLAEAVKTGTAQAKIDGVPVVIRFCGYGDTVSVLEPGIAQELPGYTAILESDGSCAYIQDDWLQTKEGFSPWEGFAGYNCKLYDNPGLSGKEVKLIYANTKLTVLWDTGSVAFIQTEDGQYFAASDTLRETRLVIAPAEESSGSSSGGGGGSGDMWTPPVK